MASENKIESFRSRLAGCLSNVFDSYNTVAIDPSAPVAKLRYVNLLDLKLSHTQQNKVERKVATISPEFNRVGGVHQPRIDKPPVLWHNPLYAHYRIKDGHAVQFPHRYQQVIPQAGWKKYAWLWSIFEEPAATTTDVNKLIYRAVKAPDDPSPHGCIDFSAWKLVFRNDAWEAIGRPVIETPEQGIHVVMYVPYAIVIFNSAEALNSHVNGDQFDPLDLVEKDERATVLMLTLTVNEKEVL